MKRSKRTWSLPAIKKLREAIEKGNIGTYLIETGERINAGSVKVKLAYKNRPWVIIIEAKKISSNAK